MTNLEINLLQNAIEDLEKYWGTGTFATEALTQEAIKALDKAKKIQSAMVSLYVTLCSACACRP